MQNHSSTASIYIVFLNHLSRPWILPGSGRVQIECRIRLDCVRSAWKTLETTCYYVEKVCEKKIIHADPTPRGRLVAKTFQGRKRRRRSGQSEPVDIAPDRIVFREWERATRDKRDGGTAYATTDTTRVIRKTCTYYYAEYCGRTTSAAALAIFTTKLCYYNYNL